MISFTENWLIFGFVRVMIMIEVIALHAVTGTNKVADRQLNFWRENLHSVEVIPNTVAASMSPLTEEEENTFAKIITEGNLQSYSSQFCKSANLLCYQTVDLVAAPPIKRSVNFMRNEIESNQTRREIFFSSKELREGGQITLPELYSPWKAFLPRNLSELFPFSTGALSDVLSSFGIPTRSNMAVDMNMTLLACEAKPQRGEIKKCTTSIEGMIDFVVSNMGSSESVELVFHPAPGTGDSGKKARVRKVVEKLFVPSSRPPLACHRLVYPYGVSYCHSVSGTNIFTMELEVPENNGNLYNATALCQPDRQSKGSVYCHLIWGHSLLWLIKENH